MSALPEEVVSTLSVHGPVRMESVVDGAPVGTAVQLAPLHRQLYGFLRPQSPLAKAVEDTGLVTFTAEDPEGEYLIRVKARAAVGRTVGAEPRRSELMHWIPDGMAPQTAVTLHLHPFHLEYVRGKGDKRMRADGPVPGSALPPAVSRWLTLARERVVVWYFGIIALDWLAVLVFQIEPHRGLLLALLMVLAGALMLGGIAILNQWGIYQRYRLSLEGEDAARLVLQGWAAPAALVRVGSGVAALGLVIAVFLGLVESWKVAAVAFVVSGAPAFGPFFGVRHLLRHDDREKA